MLKLVIIVFVKQTLILTIALVPCYGRQCEPKPHGKGSGSTLDSIVSGEASTAADFAAVTIEHFGRIVVCNRDMRTCWMLR